MDVTLARTLLTIVDTGSFKAAADRLHITQSTVSARVRTLETALGRRLLDRSKAGIALTPAGEQFYRHATALVRIWTQAQLEVAVASADGTHLGVGGQISLWDGLLLPWVSWMRSAHPEIAVTARVGGSAELVDRITEGSLDLAAVYRGQQRPGLVFEHLFDEEIVLVTSGESGVRRPDANYVLVNWGAEFLADHGEAFPDLARSGLHLDLGVLGIGFLLENRASGYFPRRVAKPLVMQGRLAIAEKAPRFVYPVYLTYPELLDSGLVAPLIAQLRAIADGE